MGKPDQRRGRQRVTTTRIQLVVNGKPRELEAGTTLGALIDQLGIDRRVVAAAHNGDVVKRDLYDQVRLAEGDRVEVVRMVGGG